MTIAGDDDMLYREAQLFGSQQQHIREPSWSAKSTGILGVITCSLS